MPVSEKSVENLPRLKAVLGRDLETAQFFRLPGSLSGYAVTQPGSTLREATQQAIYAALVPVTTASFGADMTQYWRQRQQDSYFERLDEFVLVADPDGHVVGWTGYSTIRRDSYTNIYIDSSGMIPVVQAQGVMKALMHARLVEDAFIRHDRHRSLYLSARTESPIFYRLMRGLSTSPVFPHPELSLPDDILQCGQDLARWLGQEAILSPGTLLLRNAYAVVETLYGELPVTGDGDLDRMFREQLGPLDAYLLIGKINGASDRRLPS